MTRYTTNESHTPYSCYHSAGEIIYSRVDFLLEGERRCQKQILLTA